MKYFYKMKKSKDVKIPADMPKKNFFQPYFLVYLPPPFPSNKSTNSSNFFFLKKNHNNSPPSQMLCCTFTFQTLNNFHPKDELKY